MITVQSQRDLEDVILDLLLRYRRSPQNPNNEPMKLSDIVRAISFEQAAVVAVLDALKAWHPPMVEEHEAQQERTFRIIDGGVRYALITRVLKDYEDY